MRVPDRIMVGENQSTRSPTFVGVNGPSGMNYGRDGTNQTFDMKVPDRILVVGGEQHVAAKSTPFEMQIEDKILPPTRDHVCYIFTKRVLISRNFIVLRFHNYR